MQNLARAVLVLFGLLVLVTVDLAVSIEGGKPSVPLTAQDVTGTWHGDRGARLEVTADGRARLTNAPDWTCNPAGQPAALTAEGSWIMDRHSDESPGILIEFTVDGMPPAPGCSDWFTVNGTGKGGTTGDGSDVWARFLGHGGKERYRLAPTG
ncbi:hypothetical protein [Streptomyces virginiae]|uniref:hypothetical protein n=1 Tax=Streptomyces virginiae TaxID=1961 RepID=UPI002DB5DD14|nr:hypothetical protein [Streptomyces sp. CMAA1738]MEC4570529.1 hypothetical protein [Streptomyces sp. CMAA1738]